MCNKRLFWCNRQHIRRYKDPVALPKSPKKNEKPLIFLRFLADFTTEKEGFEATCNSKNTIK